MALTMKRVARIREPGRYLDRKGLYLQVVGKNNRSWLLRWERGGRERWMGLGSAFDFTLDEARERARKARQQLKDGIDPLEQRRIDKAAKALEAAKSKTFRQCAEDYIAANRDAWKNAKHGAQWTTTLTTYAYPHIGNLSVAVIDTGLVLKCVEPIWKDKTETASRVRGRIESVLDWATVRNYRSGDNPARWRGHLEHVLPAKTKVAKPQHHAALAYADLPTFMAELRERQGSAARALEFAILTAARSGEVLGAKWDEINLDEAIWVVPEGRMKAAKEHRVPLSQPALELLRALPSEDGNEFVFLGRRRDGLSSTAMIELLRRMGRGDITVHGFRSCFMDWAHERTSHAKVVIDMALAHTVGDKVEGAYRRGDLLAKRRQLADAWAKYCASPPVEKPGYANGTVVPIRGRA
jgi:integrase